MHVVTFGIALALMATASFAQSGIEFGEGGQDTSAPVEISSDSLEVDQSSGTAVFTGEVTVTQGGLSLSSGTLRVTYADDGQSQERIQSLDASDGVIVVNGDQAAESQSASYQIGSSTLVMEGDVVLTQGPTVLSADRLTIDLATGSGRLDGRVRSVFEPGGQ